jgi:hypothetical protein
MPRAFASAVLAVLAAVLAAGPAGATERRVTGTPSGIRALYERLEPGMTVGQVAAIADRPGLGAEPGVTSWLVWSPPESGSPTAVLRVSFRDGRVVRLEHEMFGDDYRRLSKGADATVELDASEARRLWRRGQAVDDCQEALDAYHRLVLGVQQRLTPAEQQAWVRALELRREAESRLPADQR